MIKKSALLALLGGCSLTRDYERPTAAISATWPGSVQSGGVCNVTNVSWLQYFPDPRLQALIAVALQINLDLRIATARIANHLEVLDAQREVFAAEQGAAQVRRLSLGVATQLYKALAGVFSDTAQTEKHGETGRRKTFDGTTDTTTSHLTNPASEKLLDGHPKDAGQVIGYSHSTRPSKGDSQVAGYVRAPE